MNNKISISLALLLIFFTPGCVETNYILNDDTPSILEGFFGFKWITPMSIVDDEFPKRTGAKSVLRLNHYNTANFSDAYFLDELTELCVFHFNENGLNSVQIKFNTDYQTFEEKLHYLSEKLSEVYGKPIEYHGQPADRELPEYYYRQHWAKGRLNLTLLLDYKIEINAYRFIPNPIIHN